MANPSSYRIQLGVRLAVTVVASCLLAVQCTDAKLSIAPGYAHFGPTVLGVNPTLTYTVTNSGRADALLGTVTTEGLELAAPFSLVGGTCVSGGTVRANGGTCTLILSFSPTEVRSYEDRFTLLYNWANSGVDVRRIRRSGGPCRERLQPRPSDRRGVLVRDDVHWPNVCPDRDA
ncbi:MAG TPA: hypothetical protein VK524_08820 [Polyangiaceae bacterium]|nr:hypothetical protein [Polyangiaceae bacterium]